MLWMVCYDIADDRDRRRVERALRAVGERMQWSVFECVLTPERLKQLRAEIADEIDPETDSVRYYPLCAWCEEGIDWHGEGTRSEDPDLWLV